MSSCGATNAKLTADMRARSDLGIERYGVVLQPNNGRSSAVDFYQEILDAIAYRGNMIREACDRGSRPDFMDDSIFCALINIAKRAHAMVHNEPKREDSFAGKPT